jgi:hypothetical protein
LPQITIESPVPDVKSSESESEADVENPSSKEHSESEQNKSSSSSSQSESESESENEAEDKYESASKPVSPDNKSIDEPVVKSLETENLTNGETSEKTAKGQ